MHLQNYKQDEILTKLGLQREMTDLPIHPNSQSKDEFIRYVTEEYYRSQRKETDEVYNMFEFNLLHKPTGIRLTLTGHESYSGEVNYKVTRIFIRANKKKTLEILDADFDKKIIYTSLGEILFQISNLED